MADNNELIILQHPGDEIGIMFNSALVVLNEAKKSGNLTTKSTRYVSIDNIERANTDPNGKVDWHFFRTAHSVLRMCMMTATNMVHPDGSMSNVPDFTAKLRNREKMEIKESKEGFKDSPLGNGKDTGRKYWSQYDHLHPPWRLLDLYEKRPHHDHWSIASIMLVFQENFQKVIQIHTSFSIKVEKEFEKSFVNVFCSIHDLKPTDGFNRIIEMEKPKPRPAENDTGDEVVDPLEELFLSDLPLLNIRVDSETEKQ